MATTADRSRCARLPRIAVGRRRRLRVALVAEEQRLRIRDVAEIVRTREAVDDVRHWGRRRGRIVRAVHSGVNRVDHVRHVHRVAAVRIDRAGVVAGDAVLDRSPRAAVQVEPLVARVAGHRSGDELVAVAGTAARHEVLDRVVGRKLFGIAGKPNLEADAMRQVGLEGYGDRTRHRGEVDLVCIAVLAAAEVHERARRACLGIGLGRGRQRLRTLCRSLSAVDVALPCLRQPTAACRWHELRHGHQQGTRREPGRRTTVRSLQREFDDRDRCPRRNGCRVDRRDQRTDGPDLLLGQRAAVADDHRSTGLDAWRSRRPCGTDTTARAGRAGGSDRPCLAVIAATTGKTNSGHCHQSEERHT